jgi:hypothetical protein
MNYDNYKNTMPWPSAIKKPRLTSLSPTQEELDTYTKLHEKYMSDIVESDAQKKAYRIHERILMNQFKKDLLDELGITGHPKADKLYDFAWEHGHSDGYASVYSWAEELVDLIN